MISTGFYVCPDGRDLNGFFGPVFAKPLCTEADRAGGTAAYGDKTHALTPSLCVKLYFCVSVYTIPYYSPVEKLFSAQN